MGVILTRSTDIYTCARLLPDVYRSLERKSRRERSLCHLQIISMINCSGNKIPLTCVFAAIAIVFIHGLSLAVAPSEPEIREPEARAWAAAENEPARPKAGVVFMSYSTDPRIDGHGSSPMEVVYAGRLLKRVMKPAYPTLLFANKATLSKVVHGVFDDVRELNLNASLYTTEHAGAVQSLLSAAKGKLCKLYAYLQSPFARTLFLDTNIFVLQPSLPHSLLAHTLRLADIRVTPCMTTAATVAAISKAARKVATTPETPVTRTSSASVGRRSLPRARVTRF